MNLSIRVAAILLAAAALASASNVRPTGCAAPDVLATSLKVVTNLDWDDVNEKKVESIWPVEIGGIECNAGACETTGRQDRVIDNKCQCCELFRFNIERNNTGEVTAERLHSIVIYYSSSSRNGLLNDAKVLAKAMGLSDSDAATIGFSGPQDFNWRVGKEGKIALMNVRLYRQDGVWTVYFLMSRQAF